MRTEQKTTFGSLRNFYLGDPRRVASRERDFGLWWREGFDGALHRAAWIADTGELYIVRLGVESPWGGSVTILAESAEQAAVERALDGWQEICGRPDSLRWLRAHATMGPPTLHPRPLALAA